MRGGMMLLYLTWMSVLLVAFGACQTENTTINGPRHLSITDRISEAHGLYRWNEVERLGFTFHVMKEGRQVVERSYLWWPKEDSVRYTDVHDTVVYRRSRVGERELEADQAFVNDIYWLIPAFKWSWEDGVHLEVIDSMAGSTRVRISYEGEGGYTPGDTYEVMLDSSYLITNWKYFPSGVDTPQLVTQFTDYREVGGMNIAHKHWTEDKSLCIYFTDIEALTCD